MRLYGEPTGNEIASLQVHNGIQWVRIWVFAALVLFLLAALLGLVMRAYPLFEVAWPYRYLLHAHSHTAMLGFGFTAAAGLLAHRFMADHLTGKPLKRILTFNVVASLGMLVAFSFQGYGAVSIGFSTLHLVSAYWFGMLFLQKAKGRGNPIGLSLARSAVWWQFVSTLGIWALAPVSAMWGHTHWLYEGSIQFFLHFQFNGWLGMAAIALLISYLPQKSLSKWGLGMLNVGMPMGYFLSLYWAFDQKWMLVVYGMGMAMQLAGILWLVNIRSSGLWRIGGGSRVFGVLVLGTLISLGMRSLFQLMACVPRLAEMAGTGRNLVIGHIHLSMIGAVGMAVVAVAVAEGVMRKSGVLAWGAILLVTGFVLTEGLLFGQTWLVQAGMGFPYGFAAALFAASALFPLGIGVLACSAWPLKGPNGRLP